MQEKLFKIKPTNENTEINTSTALIIEYLGLKIVIDERFPWVNIYQLGDETSDIQFIKTVDLEESIVEFNEFRAWVLDWVFNNVEIDKNVELEER